MKSIVLSILLSGFILSGYAQSNESAETSTGKTTNGFLVHIKSGESQFKVMKGVNFAKNMADKGHDVLVYFDTDATHLTLAESEDFEFNGKSFRTQLDNLLASNADVRVCKGNLTKVLKKAPDEVINGIELGDPNMFFSFTEGRIVTMDY